MLELEAGSQVDRQPAVVRTVCRRPPSLGVEIIKISIGVLLSGHAWLQQQGCFQLPFASQCIEVNRGGNT